MKKNINLIVNGVKPEKVMYDTDNHSLVVLYPAQNEFKKGDVLSSLKHEYAMCIYKDESSTIKGNISAYLGIDSGGRLLSEIVSNSWGAKATYRHATEEEKQTLFNALAKEGKKWNAETLQVEDLDISEIVYNLSSACSYLNKPVPDFKSLLLTISNEDFHKYKAQITLQLIREAWNKADGFVVDYANSEQPKYIPVLDLYGDIESIISWGTAHISASCLSFPTQERALQFGNQFKDLLKTATGI